METSPRFERPSPYTPAGDPESVILDAEELAADVDLTDAIAADSELDDDAEGTLPELDGALSELADAIEELDDETASEDAQAEADADASGDADADGFGRRRASFESVAESTDDSPAPFEDAANYLASDLYVVPPANTRFEWVSDDDVCS